MDTDTDKKNSALISHCRDIHIRISRKHEEGISLDKRPTSPERNLIRTAHISNFTHYILYFKLFFPDLSNVEGELKVLWEDVIRNYKYR